MPTRDQHLKQARANEDLAELLLQSGDDNSTTWAATLIFYAALHYGRAFLAARGMTTISTHVGSIPCSGGHGLVRQIHFPTIAG